MKEELIGNLGVSGGELGPDDSPVGLRHLQLGSEALRPDGLLGVILPRLVLVSEKRENVLTGVFIDTMEGNLRLRGPGGVCIVVPTKEQEARIKSSQEGDGLIDY